MSDNPGAPQRDHDGYSPPPPPAYAGYPSAPGAQYTAPGSPPRTGYADPSAQQPYGYPGYQRTNTLSIVAIFLGFLVAPAGIICGHIALSQIKKSGEAGRPLALTGVIAGYVITGFYLAVVAFNLIVLLSILGMGWAGSGISA